MTKKGYSEFRGNESNDCKVRVFPWKTEMTSLPLTGASILWGNDAFAPVSDSPYVQKSFQTPSKIFPIFPFLKKFPILIRQNFWWHFLVIDYKFVIPPLFSLFWYISPYFGKIISWPLSQWRILHRLCPLFSQNSSPISAKLKNPPPIFVQLIHMLSNK